MKIPVPPWLTVKDIEVTPTIHVGHCGSTMFARYGVVTSDDLDRLLKHQRALAAQFGGHISMMGFVPLVGNVPRIGDDVRKKSLEVMADLGDVCTASVTSIIGSGMGVTMVRMFMTGFNLMSKTPFPQKTTGSVDEAVAWLQKLPGQQADVQRLTSGLLVKHFDLDLAKLQAAAG